MLTSWSSELGGRATMFLVGEKEEGACMKQGRVLEVHGQVQQSLWFREQS